jgi:DNA-binding GntR family transcriptional regulator
MVEHLNLRVERYVRRSGGIKRLREAATEHRRILKDVERGSFASARTRMQEHILQTREQVRRHYAKAGAASRSKR